jgi:hypothetical protein
MNLPITARRPIHRWILISTALLIYADGALAADYVGDTQMQARAMLAGTSDARPNVVNNRITPPADGHQISRTDPQEQGRQLFLGTSNLSQTPFRPVLADSKRATSNPVYVDALQSARRMILGLAG